MSGQLIIARYFSFHNNFISWLILEPNSNLLMSERVHYAN